MLELPRALQELEMGSDPPRPSAQAIRPRVHRRKRGRRRKYGSTSAVGSGRSPSARPQIRLGSARRTRGATGGSPRHYCRRRRDSFERSTLQTPYTDLLGAAFLYRSETIANDLKIVTKRLGCFRVGLPE